MGPANDGIPETHAPRWDDHNPRNAGQITAVWCHTASHQDLHVYHDVAFYKCLPTDPIHFSLNRPTPALSPSGSHKTPNVVTEAVTSLPPHRTSHSATCPRGVISHHSLTIWLCVFNFLSLTWVLEPHLTATARHVSRLVSYIFRPDSCVLSFKLLPRHHLNKKREKRRKNRRF